MNALHIKLLVVVSLLGTACGVDRLEPRGSTASKQETCLGCRLEEPPQSRGGRSPNPERGDDEGSGKPGAPDPSRDDRAPENDNDDQDRGDGDGDEGEPAEQEEQEQDEGPDQETPEENEAPDEPSTPDDDFV